MQIVVDLRHGVELAVPDDVDVDCSQPLHGAELDVPDEAERIVVSLRGYTRRAERHQCGL